MNKRWMGWGVVVSFVVGSGALAACGGSSGGSAPEDAGTDGSSTPDATSSEGGGADSGTGDATSGDSGASTTDSGSAGDSQAPEDSGATDSGAPTDSGAGDAQTAASHLLLSFNGASQSELVSFGLQSGAVEGVYVYPGMLGTTTTAAASPWLLEQQNDVVASLDPQAPWQVQSSWNVALKDYKADAGFSSSYSDPDGIIVNAGAKAYVLRYTRNEIAVIRTTDDGGVPTKSVDLSSEVQAAGDGYVEMTAGYFDPSTNRLYVLLANINRFNVGSDGYTLLCAATSPTLVAIDTKGDTLVSLTDGGTMGWKLPGYDPAFGPSTMVYDAPNNRLLVLEAGCNMGETDAGFGPIQGREIDAISLSTGEAQMLVNLDSAPFPQALYYENAQQAIVQLDTAYPWNPATGTTLGPAIANAPMAFSVDGQGNLVGVTQPGGTGPWNVVSVNPGDGGVTTLGTNVLPAADAGGLGGSVYLSGAQLWPTP